MKLEMLWEDDDPDEVLRARFGFADADAAGDWVIRTLEERWDVHADVCERIVMSDRNALAWIRTAHGRTLLKWSVAPARFRRLEAAASLTAWLGARGLPVSVPVPALDGRVQVDLGDVSMCLQRVIDGTLLDVADGAQVRAAGAALARLHDALRAHPGARETNAPLTQPVPISEQMTGWLAANGAQVPRHARDALLRFSETAPADSLPVQIVHGDYRAANVLCRGAAVVGVLDFEEMRLDHRVVELARSAVMLGTLFHDWGPVSEAVRRQFLDGYESVHALTAAESGWWDVLVLWYSLVLVPPGDDPTGWRAAAEEQLVRFGEA